MCLGLCRLKTKNFFAPVIQFFKKSIFDRDYEETRKKKLVNYFKDEEDGDENKN